MPTIPTDTIHPDLCPIVRHCDVCSREILFGSGSTWADTLNPLCTGMCTEIRAARIERERSERS